MASSYLGQGSAGTRPGDCHVHGTAAEQYPRPPGRKRWAPESVPNSVDLIPRPLGQNHFDAAIDDPRATRAEPANRAVATPTGVSCTECVPLWESVEHTFIAARRPEFLYRAGRIGSISWCQQRNGWPVRPNRGLAVFDGRWGYVDGARDEILCRAPQVRLRYLISTCQVPVRW